MSCPVDAFYKLIGQRWSSYILWTLEINGPMRFNALLKEIPGVSQKIMTEKLRSLEKAGLIHREYEPSIPPKVTYSLTHRAQELTPIMHDIARLAHAWRELNFL